MKALKASIYKYIGSHSLELLRDIVSAVFCIISYFRFSFSTRALIYTKITLDHTYPSGHHPTSLFCINT
jgi:hypothetical protein